MKTPVIFRKFQNGEVIALFPTLPYPKRTTGCKAFTLKGRSHYVDTSVTYITTEASTEEALPVLIELVKLGCDIQICKRITGAFTRERLRAYEELHEEKAEVRRPVAQHKSSLYHPLEDDTENMEEDRAA